MKQKIYAAVIAKNEEKIIARCLKSLKGFDDIYFTDTGSTDRTIQVAKAFTDKISHFEWCDDFSKARNYNLDQITKDEWVFIIDADEWLPPGEIHKIRKAIEKSKTGRCFAYVYNRNDGGYHQHLRFFKNNIRYKDPAHTHIPIKNWEFTKVTINHEPSENHKKDPKRTMRILEKIKNPSPRELYMLGREYMGFGYYKKAVEKYQKYLNKAPLTQQTAEVLTYAAQCLFMLKRTSEAQDAVLMAIKFNPEYKEALIAMASFNDPWRMRAWIKYAKRANNYGTINIPGKQQERIDELNRVSELALQGKSIQDISKSKKK